MTHRTRPRTRALLTGLGLLCWAAAGCSPDDAGRPAHARHADVQYVPGPIHRSTPDVPPAPPEPEPAVASADAPMPPLAPAPEAPSQDAPRIEGPLDSEVSRTARTHETTPEPTPDPAPAPAPVAPELNQVTDQIKADVLRTADQVRKDVTREARRTGDGLKKKAIDRTRDATQGLLQKLDRGAEDAVNSGLKNAAGQVSRAVDRVTSP